MGLAGGTRVVVVPGAVASPINHYGRPKARSIALCVVGAVHGLGLWALSTATESRRAPAELRTITVTELLTNNPARMTIAGPPQLREIEVLQELPGPEMGLPAIPVVRFSETNPSAVSSAPQLLDGAQPDVALFAQQAGLLPGEWAVVVLRVEILPSGRAGQVEVDASSGSQQVDRAATAYAQALHWVPGRLNGTEASTWIRYGVRLAA